MERPVCRVEILDPATKWFKVTQRIQLGTHFGFMT